MNLPMLRKRSDFLAMRQGCRRARRESLLILKRANSYPQFRVGITVSKKVGNAVVRNRVRRRLREIIRLEWDAFHASFDYVFIVHSEAAEVNFSVLLADVRLGLRCLG